MKASVLIAGLGLIGGSLAVSIRTAHPDAIIAGFDTDPNACTEARKRGIIDHIAPSLAKGAEGADWVILAAPVSAILNMIESLASASLKENVIVTDVGSTKRYIMLQAGQYLKGKCRFIGGHPMAGSHKSGVSASRADLFENAYYFLIPSAESDIAAVQETQKLLKGTGARFFHVSADQHDQIVGLISHFPHLIASSLVRHLEGHPIEGINLRVLAAGGFRDITRIASSDPAMWTDIVLSNRDILLDLLDEWTDEMNRVKETLTGGEKSAIQAFFTHAKQFRDGFPKKEKGAIPGYFDLYVDVPDQPDMIAQVTGSIGREGINLTNIEIIEARENVFGVLRLTFQRVTGRDRAIDILQRNGFHTYLNE